MSVFPVVRSVLPAALAAVALLAGTGQTLAQDSLPSIPRSWAQHDVSADPVDRYVVQRSQPVAQRREARTTLPQHSGVSPAPSAIVESQQSDSTLWMWLAGGGLAVFVGLIVWRSARRRCDVADMAMLAMGDAYAPPRRSRTSPVAAEKRRAA
jgi:hypothetical protein